MDTVPQRGRELSRSRSDRIIGGVCGGFAAQAFGVAAALVLIAGGVVLLLRSPRATP